ncbi:MAG: hypothetical protein Q9217_001365 [Psora testacea]
MGLNGLVTRNIAGYVRSFEVCGEWREHDLEEHSSMGRVPDGSMMLNTLVRVAIERMVVLDSFSWDLNTKMLPIVWQALAQKITITKLSIKFPSKRHPRPMTLVPPIPNLQSLKITDIDPLSYPDDISSLLLGSKNLRHLCLHWSPRMREKCEPSVHCSVYFEKCKVANYLLPLKSIAVQNLYTYDCDSSGGVIDNDVVEEITLLNSTDGWGDNGSTGFMDTAWRKPAPYIMPKLKKLRIDKVSRGQCDFLDSFQGLERLYLIGPKSKSSNLVNGDSKDVPQPSVHTPPASNSSSPGTTISSSDNPNRSSASVQTLRSSYIDTIVRNHGSTLRHLLLLPQWRLTANDIAIIIRQCPNLEQLGIGTEFENFDHLRLLVPFLPKLEVIRIMAGGEEGGGKFVAAMRELDSAGSHMEKIGQETVNREWSKLRFMELGASDMIFEIGTRYRLDNTWDAEGKEVWRRYVRRVALDEVREMDIWKMDSMII